MSANPETVEQFLARGGVIRQLPRGAMKEAGWKDADYAPNSPAMRQRSFDQMCQAKQRRALVEQAEREARKAAKVVEPLRVKAAPRPKAAKPSRAVVKVRKPKLAKAKIERAPKPKLARRRKKARRAGPFARPGTDKARVLAAIGPEWVTVSALVAQTGINAHHVREALRLLKARGLVQVGGTRWERHWRKAEGKAAKVPPPPVRPPRGLTLAVLEAVRSGCTTASDIAEATGQNVRCISSRLVRLKVMGLLSLKGMGYTAKWSVADAPAG